jgi:hypothetical protein
VSSASARFSQGWLWEESKETWRRLCQFAEMQPAKVHVTFHDKQQIARNNQPLLQRFGWCG